MKRFRCILVLVLGLVAVGQAIAAGTLTYTIIVGAADKDGKHQIVTYGTTKIDKGDTDPELVIKWVDANKNAVPVAQFLWTKPQPGGDPTNYSHITMPVVPGKYSYTVELKWKTGGVPASVSYSGTIPVPTP